MSDDLPFTGERFIPGVHGEIWIEHWHRYHFASRWVAGRRVLDVACGEGYGSALLAKHAAHVTGIDISPEAIAHANTAYAPLSNVEFLCASCTALPLADASVDIAVSFETIEHIAGQEAFLDELARVLKPDGVLVLSCPNKLEYSDKRQFTNEYHVKELYREELAALVARRFPHSQWYGQRPSFFSVIAPEAAGGAAGALVETDEERPSEAAATLSHPLYFLLSASRSPQAIASLPPALSVLSDRNEWVHRDYVKVMKDVEARAAQAAALEAQIAQREHDIEGLKAEVRAAQESGARLQALVAKHESALHAREAELVMRNLTLSEKQHELEKRRSWRWWLKLPLIRLGLLK